MGALSLKAISAQDRIWRSLARLAEPHRIYTAVAGLFGLIFVFVTPPSGAGDEPAHFERMYEVATGQWLGAEGTPAGMSEYISTAYEQVKAGEEFTKDDLAALEAVALDRETITPYENPLRIVLRIHNPLAYLVYAPAMWTGLMLDLHPSKIFLLCRLTTLLLGMLLMRQAIRLLPSRQYLAVFAALLPTPLFYLGAANIDALLMGCAFLYFALVARHAAAPEVKLTVRDIGLLATVGFCLGCAKTPYVLLPFAAILLPGAKFASPGHRFTSLAAVFIPGFTAALIWALMVRTYMVGDLAYGTVVDSYVSPSEQIALVLQEPLMFVAAVYRTIFETDAVTSAVMSAIGVFGWSEIGLPAWTYLLSLIGLIILWASGEQGPDVLSRGAGAYIQIGIFLAIVMASLFFLYLQWSAVGAATVAGFQGRYLLPILPLLFYVSPFRTMRPLKTHRQSAVFVLAVSLITSGASVWAVAARYYA